MKTPTAQTEYPKEIGQRVLAFKAKAADVAASQVELTNEARAIGALIEGWCGGRQQMSLGFYEQHRRELPKAVTFSVIQKFLAIAHRLPEPVRTFSDAKRAWQLNFEAAGLLQIPERTETQSRSTTTPFIELVNRIGRVKEALADWNTIAPIDTWDAETRATVRQQLKPLVDFYESIALD